MAEVLVTQVKQPGTDLGNRQGHQLAPNRKPIKKGWCCFSKIFCCACLCPPPQEQILHSNNVSLNTQHSSPVTTIHHKAEHHQPARPMPQKFLLPPLRPPDANMKTMVLDLDETLVHSSFKPIPNPDFTIDIVLDDVVHTVYVRKRPGVDHFMREVSKKFEIVIFTASLSKYADPLLDVLDPGGIVKYRLFREACVFHCGNFVKDLTHLGRTLESTIIIDNSPFSYLFQPDHAIPIATWFNDDSDRQLLDLLPFLDDLEAQPEVSPTLRNQKWNFLQIGFQSNTKIPHNI